MVPWYHGTSFFHLPSHVYLVYTAPNYIIPRYNCKVAVDAYHEGQTGAMEALSSSRRTTRGGLFLDIFPIDFVSRGRNGLWVEASSQVTTDLRFVRIIATFIAGFCWVSTPNKPFSWRQRYAWRLPTHNRSLPEVHHLWSTPRLPSRVSEIICLHLSPN